MKIVHLLPALTKGGGERVAVDLANHSAAAGHQVTVIAGFAYDPAVLRDSLDPAVEVRYVSPERPGRIGLYLAGMRWFRRHRAWLREQDVLHCHLTYGAAMGAIVWLMRTLGRWPRPVIVETYHAVGMPIPAASRWLHARLAARRDALALMASDDYWRGFVEKHPKLVSAVIPNGVAVPEGEVTAEERLAFRRSAGIPDDAEHVVGTVGQLRPERRPGLFLPIFADIARSLGPKCHFVLAGEGPELPRLREAVEREGLADRIHLPGLVASARVPAASMDLYLTLNVGAITGIAALEAAFAGTPVIAVQLIEGRRPEPSDWIWSSSDPAEVAAHAIKLLRSPERCSELAARQQAYVKANHVVAVMGSAYEALYRRAIERRAAPA
ncbi:glycosyltransferase family 4 protein [Allosphingosinicella sp.]|jgi:glycosyltransferase involved in cell wall biosynthesis|uniref:glycosyltransferase family 4 protein n=1 Tax=Allosphingosinicella sp. TaxID=2823234 RepID=UPI002EEE299D